MKKLITVFWFVRIESFETGNHIKQEANGYHKTVLVPRVRSDGSRTGELDTTDIIVQSGSYSYTSPDGTFISVQWISDENGFQAFGDHIPTSPPIPEPILQALNAQSNQHFDEQSTQETLTSQGNSYHLIRLKILESLKPPLHLNYNVDSPITVSSEPAESDEKKQ